MIELVILGGIVWAIVAAVQRRHEGGQRDIGSAFSVRRMFTYIMLFAAMIISAMGLTGLLGELMSSAAARADSTMAGPLAMTVVGIPVLAGLARWVRRTHDTDPDEKRSIGWSLYVNAALITSLSVGVGFAFAVADNVIDGNWRGPAVAGLIVWTAAWLSHWRVWRWAPPELMPRLHIWAGSIIGLWAGAISAGIVINGGIERVFAQASDVAAAATDPPSLWLPLTGVIIGGVVWTWHWLRHGLSSARTEGWHVTVLLFGVLAGLISAVAGAGFALYLALEWLVGDPGTTSAVAHFEQMSAPLAAVAVGLVVWRYYRSILGPSASRERTELDRVYDYLVAAVGLGTVAIGVVMLVMALFAALSPSIAGSEGGNMLLAAITLFVVGAPVWGVAWRRAQALAAGDDAEVRSTVRRTYLFGVFGVGGLVSFGALIAALVVVFEALLGERTGAVAADLDLPVALLATTGVIAAYHWMVYRAERHVEPAAVAMLQDVLFVGDGDIDTGELAARIHARVRMLHRLDVAEGAAVDMDSVVDAIAHTEGKHLLVVAGSNGDVDVIPYE